MCNFYYVDLHLATQSSKGATTNKKSCSFVKNERKKKLIQSCVSGCYFEETQEKNWIELCVFSVLNKEVYFFSRVVVS